MKPGSALEPAWSEMKGPAIERGRRLVVFARAYVRSMRLYYSFVTGIAGWLGVAYYEYLAANPAFRTVEVAPAPEKKLIILLILFLSWGVNQIINDYLGLTEDRINA